MLLLEQQTQPQVNEVMLDADKFIRDILLQRGFHASATLMAPHNCTQSLRELCFHS